MRGQGGPGLRQYAEIVHALAQREFLGRYRGNALGILTTALVPLLFLLTYTFVFTTLIPVRLRPEATRAEYAFFFFAGLVGWNLFADTAARAPRLFASEAHFVRKALFPISALPLAAALCSLYHALVWLGVFALAQLLLAGALPASLVLAPLVLLLFAVFTTGVALMVAAFGAFVRDLAELIRPVLTVLLFLSPVLYSSERIAGVAPWLVAWNPLAPLLDALRATLLHEATADAATLGAALGWSLLALVAGLIVHRRVRPVLADAL